VSERTPLLQSAERVRSGAPAGARRCAYLVRVRVRVRAEGEGEGEGEAEGEGEGRG